MTELEKLRLERTAMDEKIAAAEKREFADRLRFLFARLADESAPVCEIMIDVLGNRRTLSPSDLPKFAERLEAVIEVHCDWALTDIHTTNSQRK